MFQKSLVTEFNAQEKFGSINHPKIPRFWDRFPRQHDTIRPRVLSLLQTLEFGKDRWVQSFCGITEQFHLLYFKSVHKLKCIVQVGRSVSGPTRRKAEKDIAIAGRTCQEVQDFYEVLVQSIGLIQKLFSKFSERNILALPPWPRTDEVGFFRPAYKTKPGDYHKIDLKFFASTQKQDGKGVWNAMGRKRFVLQFTTPQIARYEETAAPTLTSNPWVTSPNPFQ